MVNMLIQATAPNGVNTVPITPSNIEFAGELQEASRVDMLIEYYYDQYSPEDDPTNPVQLNSEIEIIRGTQTIATVYVYDKQDVQVNGEQLIKLICLDKVAKLKNTLASISGEPLFTQDTPAVSITPAVGELKQAPELGDIKFRFYPNPSNVDPWLPITVSRGTATAGSGALKLFDTSATFITDGVSATDTIRNITDGSETTVSVVDSETELTLNALTGGFDNTWVTGDSYNTPANGTNTTSLDTNIGIGNYVIDSAISATKTFGLLDAVEPEFTAIVGMKFTVTGSAGNNGEYTVVSASGSTSIVVSETIPTNETAGNGTGNIVQDIIVATALSEGILPTGIIRIGSEWIVYDGYDFSANSTKFRFKNSTRGALGTAAAAHLSGDQISQRVSQIIHPIEPIFLEAFNTITSDWEPVDKDVFAVQPEEGSFDFTYDILNFNTSTENFNALRATYAVFDEDNANAVNLDDIMTSVLTETVLNGGPGLTAGQISVSGVSDVRITRVQVRESTNTLIFIRNLLDELGLNKGTDTDALGFFYDHQNDKVVIKEIIQKSTADADHNYSGITLIDRAISLDQVHSGVVIEYTSGFNRNLAAKERFWHPANGDTLAGGTVQGIKFQEEEQPIVAGYETNRDITGNNNFTRFLTDSFETTGWGLEFAPGTGTADALYGWFDDDLNEFDIEKIKLIMDFRRISTEANPINFSLLGIKNVSGSLPSNWNTDPATLVPAADKINIAAGLSVRYPDGSMDAFNKVELESDQIGTKIEGFVLRWDAPAVLGDEKTRVCLVKEIIITGNITKTQIVQTTDDDTLGSEFLYAPLSHAKLVDANFGMPRVQIPINIGQATFNSAVSLGRLALLQELAYKSTRFYEIQSDLADGKIPIRGDTATFQDGFTGVILGVQYQSVRGEETLRLRVLDFNDTLI